MDSIDQHSNIDLNHRSSSQARDITILQSYLLSICISILLHKDLVIPEGAFFNTLKFNMTHDYWGNYIMVNAHLMANSYDLTKTDLDTLSLSARLAADMHLRDVLPKSNTGGKPSFMSTCVYKRIRSHQLFPWIYGLDTAIWNPRGGFARAVDGGVSISKKSIGLQYLLSCIFSDGYNTCDSRISSSYWRNDDGPYKELLKADRLAFCNNNIMPNESRQNNIEYLLNNKHITAMDIKIRPEELFTINPETLKVLQAGFGKFSSIVEVSTWWLSIIPILEQAISSDNYTEPQKVWVNQLITVTAIVLTSFIEVLEEAI